MSQARFEQKKTYSRCQEPARSFQSRVTVSRLANPNHRVIAERHPCRIARSWQVGCVELQGRQNQNSFGLPEPLAQQPLAPVTDRQYPLNPRSADCSYLNLA